MSVAMFVIGFVIFSAYVYFMIWNIYYGARKQREENYPNYYDRHGPMGEPKTDDMDMDGMGNFSRFPSDNIKIEERKLKRKEYETIRRTKK